MEPSQNSYMITPEPTNGLLADRSKVIALITVIYLGVIAGIGYFVISALSTSLHTGILSVKTSDSTAIVTISADNHAAKIMGTGNATVRLDPGTYYLFASAAGSRTSAVVQVAAHKTANAYLDLQHSTAAPSPETINYENLDSLLNSGITSDQITLLKQYFFDFKPNAQDINIDPVSVQPGPHDPNTSVGFTLNFDVKVDTTAYKATLTYADASSLQLQLFDDQGKVIFDSNQVH